MDNQTKIVFALLAIIAILTGIFVLKIIGVIKPSEKHVIQEQTKEEEKDIWYNRRWI